VLGDTIDGGNQHKYCPAGDLAHPQWAHFTEKYMHHIFPVKLVEILLLGTLQFNVNGKQT
jgi:hypothetical protein